MTKQRIVATAGVCGGEPRIAGSRVTVAKVVECFLNGWSFTKIAEQYPIRLADAEAAVRYRLADAEAAVRYHMSKRRGRW